MRSLIRIIIFVALSGFLLPSHAREKDPVADFVNAWCAAHNNWRVHKLRLMYARRVMYYGQWTDVEKVLAEKSTYFRPNAAFSMQIASTITVTPFTASIKKCEFIKEVHFKGKTDRSPAYLLILTKNYEPEIVGESDLISDKKTGFSPAVEDFTDYEASKDEIVTPADDDSYWFYYTLGGLALLACGILIFRSVRKRV